MEIKSVSNEIPSLSTGEIFQEILDKAAIAVITDSNGTVIFVNDNFCRVSKYSTEELLGKSSDILRSDYHPDAFYHEIRHTVSTGKTWVGEIKNRAKDGGIYWIQTTIVPILSPEGGQVQYLSFGVDITSQKAAMEEVAKIREQFNIIASNFPNGYISLIDSDLRILFSGGLSGNKQYRRDPEGMIGKHIKEVLSTETASAITKSLPQVLKGETVVGEIHLNGQDYQSTFRPIFEPSGSVNSFVLVVQDITDVKKMALEAKKNNDLFSVIERTGSWEWDIETGEVVFSSNAMSLLGIEDPGYRDGFDGILERVHPDDREAFKKETELFVAESKPFDWEFRVIKPNGEIRFMQTSSIIYKTPTGQAFRMIGVIKDITDRRRAEELVEKNMQMLFFQNKQLLDFCNIVSHNLRSPLINLSMLIGFIEESRTEEEKRGFIEKMKPVIENLNETFEELVESIQIKQDVEIVSENIPIGEYFQKVISGFEGQILETGAKLEADFSDAPEVYFPPKYFLSVLHNLISNALKYHAFDRQPEVKVFTRPQRNGNVLLVVQDNGLGIDLEKHRDSLFKMRKVFHRHPDAKGFGLFITKTQVESMNGKIWAESEPDKGSSFFVEFRNREV